MDDNSVTPQPPSATVALFQKAHGRLTTLQRIEDQIDALAEQRRKAQEELRAVQALINEELDHVTRTGPEGAGPVLTHVRSFGDADTPDHASAGPRESGAHLAE